MNSKYTFTVFTPTYNRAKLIHKVFESLMYQTFKNFEWLIVDDGSSDDTQSVIDTFKKEAWFNIRYIKQDNGGKHRAINRGVKEARGKYFIIFDSDDRCTKNALERFNYHWSSIADSKKDDYFSVTSLCKFENGEIVGDKFPEDIFDSNFIDLRLTKGIKGDIWVASRTKLLEKFPFPEFYGEKFIAESSVWHEVSKYYKTRFINEALEIVEYQIDGLSSESKVLRKRNCYGSMYCYSEQFYFNIPLKLKLKASINCIRFTWSNWKAFQICVKKIYLFILYNFKRDSKK